MIMDTEHQEDYTKKLYEASMKGCVATLNTLLQQDPLILDRISLTSFAESPLHVSSLLGHVDFSAALLHHKPGLSGQLNSQRQSPLHLASASGYTEVVKALLSVNTDVGLVLDQKGRIPLHFAVMRGQVEVIPLLIRARPESVLVKLHGQETVLHLCVKYNHLEALKLLVTFVKDDLEFLNLEDSNGNTILHLAVIMNQIETIKYLLSVPDVRVEADALIPIFRNDPFDFQRMPIDDSIAERRSKVQLAATPPSHVLVQNEAILQPAEPSRANGLMKYLDFQGNWLEKMRGNLMIVASVISSMAFQAGINPPQAVGERADNGCPRRNPKCELGIGLRNQFTYHNTIAFAASMGILFWLLCGYPLKRRVPMVILLIAMGVTIYSTSVVYNVSIRLTSKPNDITIDNVILVYSAFWISLTGVIVAFHAIKLYSSREAVTTIFALVKMLHKLVYKMQRGPVKTQPLATNI